MADASGFFEFDTNINEPVGEIVSGLERLERSLSGLRSMDAGTGVSESIGRARAQVEGLFRNLPGT